MRQITSCLSKSAIYFVVLGATAGQANSQDNYFEYENCSDQSFGPPLAACATIHIDQTLSRVKIRDIFDYRSIRIKSADFLTIEKELLPIAIPRKNYSTSQSWVYAGRKYIKFKSGVKTFISKRTVDVIAVVKNISEIKDAEAIDGIASFEIQENIEMTLWYSEKTGILAIGMPKKSGLGDVFYCASEHCLFEQSPAHENEH